MAPGSVRTARTSTTAWSATARATRATGSPPPTWASESLALDRSDSAARRGRWLDRSLRVHRGDRRRRDVSAHGGFDWQRSGTNDSTRLTRYVLRYGVQLFHNFTYFLNDPDNGDQFEQFERRWTTGGKLTHRRLARVGGKPTESAFGVDVRNDSVGGPLGLYHTRNTERLSTSRADEVDQISVGMFGDTEIEWSRTIRTTFGLRGDVYRWKVRSDNPLNSGERRSGILSPKVSAAFGPWGGTEFYANWGWASIPTPLSALRSRSIRSQASRRLRLRRSHARRW